MSDSTIPLLIVSRSLDTGGAERHLLQVLPRLDQRRFSVELLPLHPGGGLEEAYVRSGLRIYPVAGGWSRVPRFMGSLVRAVRERRPIVHTFLPEAYLLAAPLSLMGSASGLVMSRRSLNVYQDRHPWMARIERSLHPHMHALLGNSQAVVEQLLLEGAPAERVHVLYNGIDLAPYPVDEERLQMRQQVRAALGVSADEYVLACVANLFAYKGHADLLNALGRLPEALAGKVHLLCIGRDEGVQAELEAQARSLRVRVRFLGARDDIPQLLAAADIGVLVSHQEGFSNALLECMASGLPMVVSDVGGNAEAVIHRECGFVVPAHDPFAISKALAMLLDDSSRRIELGKAGRARVEAYFSIDACVSAYEALYEEVWEQRNKASYF